MRVRLLLALGTFAVTACTEGWLGPPPPPPPTSCEGSLPTRLEELYPKYFAAEAATGCARAGCHATPSGGLQFRDAHELWQATVGKADARGKTWVVAGSPADSYLLTRLTGSDEPRMPLGGPYLDAAALREISGWICAGAPEPPLSDAGTPPDGGTPDGGATLTISGFTPGSGVVGTMVMVSGTGFSTSTTENVLTFNGTAATVTAATADSLTTSVPFGATTGRLLLTVGGAMAQSPSDFMVVTANPVPTLTSVSPASALAGTGPVSITATGTGFVTLSTLEWNGAALTTTYVSSTSLTASLPASLLGTAGPHTLTVTNPGPGGGTSAGVSFAVDNPAPAITSLTPPSVLAGAGDVTIDLDGTGFVAASGVTVNGAAVTATLVSATRLRITVLAALTASPGSLLVAVTNPAPGGGTSAAATFTVANPLPVLTSSTPASVMLGSPTQTVSLGGSGFIAASKVRFDGADLPTTLVSSTALTATVDAALLSTAGVHQLTVVNPAPGGGTSASRTLSVANPAPVLTSINPTSVAVASAPFSLSLTGSGFVAGSQVSFNGTSVATTFVSSTALTAQIPTISAAGSYPITVTNAAPGGGTSASATLTAAISTTPTINGLSPSPARAGSSFTLTVSGSGYSCAGMPSQLFFNSVALTVTGCSSMQLQATVSAQTAGTYPVQVKNSGGTSVSNVVDCVVVAPNPVPQASSLSPSSAAIGGAGTTLTVNGSGFVSSATVSFNGSPRATTFVSATQLTAALTSADLATAGSFPVTVINPAPGGGTSNAVSFSVVASNPVPTVSSLTPASVAAGSGAVVVSIGGTGFVAGSTATYGGASRSVTYVSATRLDLSLGAADTQTAGSYPVVVTNPAPGGGASNAFSFTVVTQNPAPVLTSISPSTVLAGGSGFTLTATGSSFISGSAITFNGVAKATTFVSATTLTATVSAADVANAGTFPVAVTTPGPGGGTSASVNLTVTNPVPTATSLSPSSIAINSGPVSLAVNGSGFVASSVVQVDGAAVPTSLVNATQLSASLPSYPATGTHAVTVVNPAPGGGTSGALTLTIVAMVNPVPVVTSLSPCGKVAGSGAFTLTVNGTSFVSGATATFNGAAVTVTFVSATQLTAAIPAAAIASAPANNAAAVVVSNPAPGGGAASPAYFGVANAARTLSGNVQPIFTASCATIGCHVSGTVGTPMALEAGFAYGNLVGVTSTGCPPTPRVLACGALRSQSVLVDKVKATMMSLPCSGSPMPKGAPITNAQIQAIVDWVAQGAPNN